MYHGFYKNMKQHNCFHLLSNKIVNKYYLLSNKTFIIIDNNNKCLLSSKSIIIE